MTPAWITNCPRAAAKLNAADEAYDKAKLAAAFLPLSDKIVALREAKAERVKAYGRAIEKESGACPHKITIL